MLIQQITNQRLNTIQLNKPFYTSGVKNECIQNQTQNTTVLPSYYAVRGYANISFKGVEELVNAGFWDYINTLKKEIEHGTDINGRGKFNSTAFVNTGLHNSVKCFKELRKHPDVDMYAEDDFGNMCFTGACCWGYTEIIQDLCDDLDFDVNYQSKKTGDNGLIVACRNVKEEAVDIILQRDDVDLTLRNKENKSAFDYAEKDPSILKKLQNYEAKQKELAVQKQAEQKYPDKRTKSITPTETKEAEKELTPEEKIQKLLTFKYIWTDEEKAKVEKLIEEKNYGELAALLVTKADAINDACSNLKLTVAEVTSETQKAVRTSETEQIRKEEQEKAKQALKEREQEVAKAEEEIALKNQTLDNMIRDFNKNLAEDVEFAKSNFRAFYGIEKDTLPEKMGLAEQISLVNKTLIENKNKLANPSKNTPQNVLHALQNNNEQISKEGLDFLEGVLKANEKKCSEEDLISAITSVKTDSGSIDFGKSALFLSTLAWGFSSMNEIVNEVKKYSPKNKNIHI